MSLVQKHSVTIRGHRTSFSLERPFLDDLRTIAAERGLTLAALVGAVDAERPRDANLSSALRIFVLEQAKRKSVTATAWTHRRSVP
ncbi:MAG TPA: ribbon-helix-helix domain-containing protein [Rhizobiaceae bacterium]